VAVIYQDAYTLFGTDPFSQGPQSLETAVLWAVHDDKPDPVSVERVICQIYGDLARWFYRSARADAALTGRFYRKRLRKALTRWSAEPWRVELRRDLIWLEYGQDVAAAEKQVGYLDPCDYVNWALAWKRLPQTLVGRSHGDLHGRNILVGVQRGEVEFPAVFDYGDMDDKNVLVWDFVKLETELKVRLLLPLYKDQDVRQAMLTRCRTRWPRDASPLDDRPSADVDARSLRVKRLAFSFEFESLLAELTNRIGLLADVGGLEPPGGRNITGEKKIDRALAILLRIRQEAALWLGDRQPERGPQSLWKDAYYFALGIYGLCSAKFSYKKFETEFALVSAGVAAANVDAAKKQIRDQMAKRKPARFTRRGPKARYPYPCYRVPLAHAHRLWRARRTQANVNLAVRFLDHVARRFGHSVPVLQEYALLLAEAGRHDAALELLQPIEALCQVFRDEETLSRVGRLCKDLGDQALEDNRVPVTELAGHPARQWYLLQKPRQAAAFYRQALSSPRPDQVGMVQSAYNQVCRLHWALQGLGERNVAGAVVTVFQDCPFRLRPGPLGNCGLGSAGVGSTPPRGRKTTPRRAKPRRARPGPRKEP